MFPSSTPTLSLNAHHIGTALQSSNAVGCLLLCPHAVRGRAPTLRGVTPPVRPLHLEREMLDERTFVD